jgi:hypothetical protein
VLEFSSPGVSPGESDFLMKVSVPAPWPWAAHVDAEELHLRLHRSVLSTFSPVFCDMFSSIDPGSGDPCASISLPLADQKGASGSRESTSIDQGGVDQHAATCAPPPADQDAAQGGGEVAMKGPEGWSRDAWIAFFKLMYRPGGKDVLTPANFMEVVKLADFYEARVVLEDCEKWIRIALWVWAGDCMRWRMLCMHACCPCLMCGRPGAYSACNAVHADVLVGGVRCCMRCLHAAAHVGLPGGWPTWRMFCMHAFCVFLRP